MELTVEQQQIVRHGEGHARVSAVAGSGKTTAMVARVRYLLEQGVQPDHILILMFNRSAREAFADKLRRAVGPAVSTLPAVRTFHSLGLRLVNSFTARGALPSFTLVTEEYQQEKLAREAVQSLINDGAGERAWLERDSLEGFLLFIDLVKADVRPVRKQFDSLSLDDSLDWYIPAFELFERMRKNARVRFFSDLLHEPLLALRRNRELADWVANRVDHIIVDEYQDINEVQQQLLRVIGGTRARLMVVGDVDQCIYEWRGARPYYIVSRFHQDFPGARNYTLSYTFRFGHRLSLAANHLINNNRLRDRKLCLSFSSTPDTRLYRMEERETHPVVRILLHWQEQGRSLEEAAVLVRIFAISVSVELALLKEAIPYRLLGHDTVFHCPEVRALLGYLHLCFGDLDRLGQEEGGETVSAMLSNPHLWLSREETRSLAEEILAEPARAGELIRIAGLEARSQYLQSRMHEIARTWERIMGLSAAANAAKALQRIIDETDLFDFYRFASRSETAENRIRTCGALIGFARSTGKDVAGFLKEIGRLRQMEGQEETRPRLLITSMHRAKGLEWPLVILPGLADGTMPWRKEEDGEGGAGIEDERRLMYVAMTRAREQLYLLHPPDTRLEQRAAAGDARCPASTKDRAFPASCFLYEANPDLSDALGGRIVQPEEGGTLQARSRDIARQYLNAIGSAVPIEPAARPGRKRKKKARRKSPWLGVQDLSKGRQVRHPAFGIGTVRGIERRQGVVTVEFPEFGLQNMVVRLARLQPV